MLKNYNHQNTIMEYENSIKNIEDEKDRIVESLCKSFIR